MTCKVLSGVIFFVKKSLYAAAGDDSLHLIGQLSAAAAHTDPNSSKDGTHGECMLIFLDTEKHIAPKYGINNFIIRSHYKWEDREIDTIRHNFPHYYSAHLQATIILVSEYFNFSLYTLVLTVYT